MNNKELENINKIEPNFDSHLEKGTIEKSNEYYNLLEEKMVRLINKDQKYKEVIDKAIDYAENGDLLYLANKCSVIHGDNVEVVSISDILNDLLTKLK